LIYVRLRTQTLYRDERLIMARRTIDLGALHSQPSDGAAQATDARSPVCVKAMSTASRLFSATCDPGALPDLAASLLAVEPGQMCVVSLAGPGDESLRPVAIAHVRPNVSRSLRGIVAPDRNTPADAFSRTVLRSGRALRMAIGSPHVLRLWLPSVYWPYAERAGVSGVLAAALRDRDRVFGALLLLRERDQPAFNEVDQTYVTSLAARLALALTTHPLLASIASSARG
jgi:GAF domain-containing protein